MRDHIHEYFLRGITITNLGYSDLLKHGAESLSIEKSEKDKLKPLELRIDFGLFSLSSSIKGVLKLALTQTENSLLLTCSCNYTKNQLCSHQSLLLAGILENENLKVFFDPRLRKKKLFLAAKDYGLSEEPNLESFFNISYEENKLIISPKSKELLPINPKTKSYFKENLLFSKSVPSANNSTQNLILVFSENQYYDGFKIELINAYFGKDGKIKNPLEPVDPLSLVYYSKNLEEAKFYTAVSRFQNNVGERLTDEELLGLRLIVENNKQLNTYYQEQKGTGKITVNSISKVELEIIPLDIKLSVDLRKKFYEIIGEIEINNKWCPLNLVKLKFDNFIHNQKVLYLIEDPNILRVIHFFKNNNEKILIHPSKFEEFKKEVLENLQDQIQVNYAFIKPATKKQFEEQGFSYGINKLIYLSEHETYVLITPVVRYGNIEIPVFSRREIHDTDQNGNVFKVKRDQRLENQFIAVLARQHPDFKEQLNEWEYFYLHKDKFLDEDWFLTTFEIWRKEEIEILGFNDLKGNKLNQNKASVSVSVKSGIDWFNTALTIKFGDEEVSLQQINKSIRNKSKFVVLDDGTKGILPIEWMKKISKYLEWGEIVGDLIKIPKVILVR